MTLPGGPAPSYPSMPWGFAGVGPDESPLDSSRIVVLPVPYDSTTSYRSGARDGPSAIIEASRHLEDYDPETDREVYRAGIHTLPDMEAHAGGPEAMTERIASAVRPLAGSGRLLAVLGGEHSISVGVVRALREAHDDLSVLYVDAHADLRDEYMGSAYSHACAARRIWEMCPVVEVGVRSMSLEEAKFIRGGPDRLRVIQHGEGGRAASWDAAAVLDGLSEHVYVSIDLDVFDPALMAAVGTPEPGGPGWEAVLGLLRSVCRERSVVGFDVVELCPWAGPPSCAYVAAKLAYKLIGYATERDAAE